MNAAAAAADTFCELADLLDRDPDEYRRVVDRLKRDNPSAFEAFVDHVRAELATTHERDDRPLTPEEITDMIDRTARELGWPRERVVSEGVMRLRAAMHDASRPFRPVTPERDPAKRRTGYARRHSSMRALVVGDVQAVLKKKRAGARGDPRRE